MSSRTAGGGQPARAPVEMVRVLEEDPELGEDLSGAALDAARGQAVAPLLRLGAKSWTHLIDEDETHGHLGLLLLDGLIARHMRFGEMGSTELLGPGGVIRPWRRPQSASHAVELRWEVLSPARLAVLDREFALRIGPWPEVVAMLLERGSGRADALQLQAALRQAVRVEDRVLLALWHFADRWGEETSEGRTITIPRLTGAVLASIVGARRQSVSSALGALADREVVKRGSSGTWTLTQRPPQPGEVVVGRRASDRVELLSADSG